MANFKDVVVRLHIDGTAAGMNIVILQRDSGKYLVATMYFLLSLTAPISRLLIIMLFFSVSDNCGRAVFVDD